MFDTATCDRVLAQWAAMHDDARQSPGGFGDLSPTPGPDLAADLHRWEPDTRSDDELIDRIGAWEKLKASAEASQLAEIAELAARRRHSDQLERADHAVRGGQGEPGQVMEFLADEIALAARISRVAANNRLDLAQDLTGRLLAVFAALQAGTIELLRARIIVDGTRTLDKEVRAVVADAVLVKAPAQTPARYGPRSPGRCTSSTRPGPRNDTRPTSPTGG